MSSGFAADLLSLTEPNRSSSRHKSEMPPSEHGVGFAGVLQTARQGSAEQAEGAEASETSTETSNIDHHIPPYVIAQGESDIEADADQGEEMPESAVEEIADGAATDDVLQGAQSVQSVATPLAAEPQTQANDTADPADAEPVELKSAPTAVSTSDAIVRTDRVEAPVADASDEPVEPQTEAAAETAKPELSAKAAPGATGPATDPGADKASKPDAPAAPVASDPTSAAAPIAAAVTPAAQPGKAGPAVDPAAGVRAKAEPIPGETVDVPASTRAKRSADTAAVPRGEEFAEALTSDSGLEHSKGIEKSGGAAQAGLSHSASPFALAAAPGLSGQPVGTAAQILPNPVAMTATATMIAAPEEIVDIFTTKLAGAERPERITIQLDPPELGRVSIEFKFDAQGLQHVAVTSDTPEAMQRLRMMHADLVQSLEQHGLNARDMSFSQNTPQRDQNMGDAQAYSPFARQDDTEGPYALQPVAASRQIRTGSGGLNIKL